MANRLLVNDALDYHQIAVRIINGLPYISTTRPPGYPCFIALIYKIFGIKPWLVIIAQQAINVSIIIVLYLFLGRICSKKVGLWGAILFSLEPTSMLYSLALLSETLFSLAIILGLGFFVIGLLHDSRCCHYLGGLFIGAAILIRPIAIFLPIILIPVILLAKLELSNKFKIGLRFIISAALVVVPWMTHNLLKYDSFAISSIGGYNMLYYNAAMTESVISSQPLEVIQARLRSKFKNDSCKKVDGVNPFKLSAQENKVGLNYLRNHMLAYLKVHARGCAAMLLSPDISEFDRRFGFKPMPVFYSFVKRMMYLYNSSRSLEYFYFLYSNPYLVIVYILAVFGLATMDNSSKPLLLTISFSAIYFILITGPVGDGRFRVPIMPITTLASAIGLEQVRLRISCRKNATKQHNSTQTIEPVIKS